MIRTMIRTMMAKEVLMLLASLLFSSSSRLSLVGAWSTSSSSASTSSAVRPAFALSMSSSTTETAAASAEAIPSSPVVTTTTMRGKTVEHKHCQEPGDRDILIRAARGEITERTPVWMMRQAGRYMSAFREYSDAIPFRLRSETPDYAVELSMQCHRAYGMDGIIMFSDILTPLPVLNIDFDVVKGVGPVITTKIRTEDDVTSMPTMEYEYDFDEKLPFIREILQRLSQEAQDANTSLIGFVGAPFTLASYTIEGKSSKHCLTTKKLLMADELGENKCATLFLDKIANMIGQYACHQIDCGAQVIQVFESWAHQLSPDLFQKYAKPAAMQAIRIIKQRHPNVPVIYFANGGSSYLELQRDKLGADMIAVDWSVDMKQAREILGHDVPISGNIDPTILFGSQEQIEQAVRDCIDRAGGPGNRHLLNLGHGVMQGTPEIAVQWLVDEVKRYKG